LGIISRIISLDDAISGTPSTAIGDLEDAGDHRQKKRSVPEKKSARRPFDLFHQAGLKSAY
jgi:hypothetical protein